MTSPGEKESDESYGVRSLVTVRNQLLKLARDRRWKHFLFLFFFFFFFFYKQTCWYLVGDETFRFAGNDYYCQFYGRWFGGSDSTWSSILRGIFAGIFWHSGDRCWSTKWNEIKNCHIMRWSDVPFFFVPNCNIFSVPSIFKRNPGNIIIINFSLNHSCSTSFNDILVSNNLYYFLSYIRLFHILLLTY